MQIWGASSGAAATSSSITTAVICLRNSSCGWGQQHSKSLAANQRTAAPQPTKARGRFPCSSRILCCGWRPGEQSCPHHSPPQQGRCCPPLPWAAPSSAMRSGLNGICLALFPFKAGSQKVILIYKLRAWQSSSGSFPGAPVLSAGGQVRLSLPRGIRLLGVLLQEGQEFLQYLIKLLRSEHYSILVKTIPELCP